MTPSVPPARPPGPGPDSAQATWTKEPPSVDGLYDYRVNGAVVRCRVESMFGVMPVAFREDNGGFNRVDLLTALNPDGEWRPVEPDHA